MKKPYEKPRLYAESFELAEHIATPCGIVTSFNTNCAFETGRTVFFTRECGSDVVILWEGAGVDPDTATYEDLVKLGDACYNQMWDSSALHTS